MRSGRTDVVDRLRQRRGEIEETLIARTHGISDPVEVEDPTYAVGLRAAVAAALDYGLASLESAEGHPPDVPALLLVQARLAARNGVSLDTVLRRYFAGYTVLTDYLIEEAGAEGQLADGVLQRFLRARAPLFERLLDAVSEEYERDGETRPVTRTQRVADLVAKLLGGERIDADELDYDVAGWHQAIVVGGPGAADAVADMSRSLDRRALIVHRPEGVVWAWLGGRRMVAGGTLEERVEAQLPERLFLAIGEPGCGLSGWRLSHRQAIAAAPIARERPGAPVSYADVALLTAALQNDLLATSLHEVFLAPLDDLHWGDVTARETLRAYFLADRHVSSAAAILNLNRHTVTKRIRAIEERLGRSLSACNAEIETALQLEELTSGEHLVSGDTT